MRIQSFEQLFQNGLEYLYDAENQLVQALPKMSHAATTQELRQAFGQHLIETQQQVTRLEQVFQLCNLQPSRKPNVVLQAMTQEVDQMVSNIDASHLRDAALIVAGNQVEHFEMGSYGSLKTWAQLMGNQKAVQLLDQSLQEEKAADQKLTQVGESTVNQQAAKPLTQTAR